MMFVECLIMCKCKSTAGMTCTVLSEFLLCLDKKMVTENRKMHFFHWCLAHPEDVLHLTNVSAPHHSCSQCMKS
jgi:hypothetical protein